MIPLHHQFNLQLDMPGYWTGGLSHAKQTLYHWGNISCWFWKRAISYNKLYQVDIKLCQISDKTILVERQRIIALLLSWSVSLITESLAHNPWSCRIVFWEMLVNITHSHTSHIQSVQDLKKKNMSFQDPDPSYFVLKFGVNFPSRNRDMV